VIPLLTFYGDDFTGTVSTAHLLTNLGVPTVVFPTPPDPESLAERFPDVQAVGVAGEARTWSPDEMDRRLPAIFTTMKQYGSPVFLYKVCSTFDSAPHIGSIGKAIDIGTEVFPSNLVPVIPAAPGMGRVTVFGNHFARAADGHIYRLDRHQSMANHPTTPMHEADLLRHLADQTTLPGGLVDIRTLEGGSTEIDDQLKTLEGDGVRIALFDTVFDRHLDAACGRLWKRANPVAPLFVVGSHEVGAAFARSSGMTTVGPLAGPSPGSAPMSDRGPILAVSGSCSAMTRLQILVARSAGFAEIAVNVDTAWGSPGGREEQTRIVAETCEHLASGRSVIVHTCMGPDDSRIGDLAACARQLSRPVRELHGELGDILGRVVTEVLQRTDVKRIAVAGGDTSGRVQAHLGINALQIITTEGSGDPICTVSSDDPVVDRLEVAFKGGQVGGIGYFAEIRDARTVVGSDPMHQKSEETNDEF